MNNFSSFEKNISKLIKFNPFLHAGIKLLYQYVSYSIHKEKNFRFYIHKKCKLINLNTSQTTVNKTYKNSAEKSLDNNFYGYYDHSPLSNNMKYFICHNILENSITLDLYSFSNSKLEHLKTIAKSNNYNLQQGIRPIWISDNKFIFNDVNINNNLISRIFNIEEDSFNDIDMPIQEICSRNNILLSIDYTKLDIINKDYGYRLDNNYSQKKINGIIGYNYVLQKILFEISLDHIHSISQNKNLSTSKCEINHISHSPYEEAFVFIYRNRTHKGYSELYEYNYRTNNLRVLYSGNLISHYCWIDKKILFAYLEKNNRSGFYEINYKDSIYINQNLLNQKEDNTSDGHPSVSVDNKWIVFDTYPNKARQSHLYIIRNDINKKSKRILIGKFYSPLNFNGYNRCDLHPRWSSDGKYISIDSAHEGRRKTYLIDVSEII